MAQLAANKAPRQSRESTQAMNRLTRISRSNVQIVKQLYCADRAKNVVTINAITNILDRIAKTPALAERIEFLSLNDSWRENGTILIRNESRVFFSTLEAAPYESVKCALDGIEIGDEITFVAISDRFRGIVKDALWYGNMETTFEQGTVGYFMPRELAMNLPNRVLPDNFEARPLTAENIDEINRVSPREGGDDLNYIANAIEHKETLGVFEKSSNQLLGWCLAMDFCSVGMGVVKSHLRRSGLGGYLLLTMSKRIAIEKNVDINWNVIHGHSISHKWTCQLGATKFDTFTWLTARRRQIAGASRFGLFQIVY